MCWHVVGSNLQPWSYYSGHLEDIKSQQTVTVQAQPPGETDNKRVKLHKCSILGILWKNSCAWPDSNVCVTTNLSNPPFLPLPPPSDPSSQIPPPTHLSSHSLLLSSHYTNPLHHPAILSSIPHPHLPTLPADGEHELTSDDGSTLSQSLSLTQSLQSTPAKEGITQRERKRDFFFRAIFTALLCVFEIRCVFLCVCVQRLNYCAIILYCTNDSSCKNSPPV